MSKNNFIKKFFQGIPSAKKTQKKASKTVAKGSDLPAPKPKKQETKKESDSLEKDFKKSKEWSADLDSKIDEMTKSHDLSKERVNSFLDNQDNFSQVEWAIVKARREELKMKLKEAAGEKEVLEAEEKKQQKKIKGKKGKIIGARKKWLKMD